MLLRSKHLFIALLMLIASGFLLPHKAEAHAFEYGAIETDLAIQGSTIMLRSDVPYGLTFSDADTFFRSYFSYKISVSQDGNPCPFTLTSFDVTTLVDRSTFDGRFECPETITNIDDLAIHTTLFSDYFTRYDHFVTVSQSDQSWELLFTQDATKYPGAVSARHLGTTLAYFLAVAQHFLWLGMTHIWTGYDHILFLLSIILVLPVRSGSRRRSLKDIVLVVTSFTIAHTLTLLLAGFQIVTLSPRLVEPTIALTIAYVAVRNIQTLRSDKNISRTRERLAVIFGFGLIHGLGFASALSETRIPADFFVPALLIFNVGVELGQLAILALIVPLLLWVGRQRHARMILLSSSIVILCLALVWFVQRI